MKRAFLAALLLAAVPARAETLPAACAVHLPLGAPSPAFPGDTLLCRKRIAIAHDSDAKSPRWVAYAIRASDAWACGDRENKFRADPDLVRLRLPRAELSDYAGSGWDRGHLAADADMRADAIAASEADYLSNIAPQNPTLNRGLWNRIEAMARVWAADRGEVLILTGTVRPPISGERRIGRGVLIPAGFFKVVLDPARKETLAFLVPNGTLPWRSEPAHFVVPVELVEEATGLFLPLPSDAVQSAAPWPADLGRFAQTKELVCASAGMP